MHFLSCTTGRMHTGAWMKNKKDNPAAKKGLILRSAEKVFARNGFHKTQMDDIAMDAGIAKGTVYLYFKNKEELFVAIFENIHMQALKIIETIKNLPVNPVEKLSLFIKNQLEVCKKNIGLFIMMGHEIKHMDRSVTSRTHKLIIQKHKKIILLLSSIIKNGIKKKYFKTVDPLLASISLLGILESVIIKNILFDKKKKKMSFDSAFIINTFLKGIQKD